MLNLWESRPALPQKIIPDSKRHRCVQELYNQVLATTPLVIATVHIGLWELSVQNWREQQQRDSHHPKLPWDVTKEFQHRIQVNYLRHCASNYDELRATFLAMSLPSRAQFILHGLLKTQALKQIEEQYPEFRDQCRKQQREQRRVR